MLTQLSLMQNSHCIRHSTYDDLISNRRFHFLEFLNSNTPFLSRKHILLLDIGRRISDLEHNMNPALESYL